MLCESKMPSVPRKRILNYNSLKSESWLFHILEIEITNCWCLFSSSAILSKDPHRQMTSVCSVIYTECLVGHLPLSTCCVIYDSPLSRAVKIKCPFIQRCIGEMGWAFEFQTRASSLGVEAGGQKNLRWLSSLEGWIEFTQDTEREEWRMQSDFRDIKRKRGQLLKFMEQRADHFWLG